MNHSKYTNEPKLNSNSPKLEAPKTDAPNVVPIVSADAAKPSQGWRTAPAVNPGASSPVTPAPVAAPVVTPVPAPAVSPAPAPAVTPAPAQAVTTSTEKAGQAMVNEGGNSVVMDAPKAVTPAVVEPNALTDEMPAAPVHSNGAAGPQTPVLQAKPADRASS